MLSPFWWSRSQSPNEWSQILFFLHDKMFSTYQSWKLASAVVAAVIILSKQLLYSYKRCLMLRRCAHIFVWGKMRHSDPLQLLSALEKTEWSKNFNMAFFSSSASSSLLISIYDRWLKHISLGAFFFSVSFLVFFPLKAVFVVFLLQKDTLVRKSLRCLYCWVRIHPHPLHCSAPIIGSPGQLRPVKIWRNWCKALQKETAHFIGWLWVFHASPCSRSWLPKSFYPTAPEKRTWAESKVAVTFAFYDFP